MTNLIRLAALIAIGLTTSTAHAAVSNRAECYDVVIAHCNTTAHPQECAKGGMDQCDTQFKEIQLPPRKPFGLKTN